MGKKSSEKKRKRFQFLNVNITSKEATDEPGTIKINLELDLLKGTSKVFNSFSGEQIKSNHLIMGYIGENKWKHTFQIKSDAADDTYGLAQKLERYKHIIAIDTNTKLIESTIFTQPTKVSLGAAVVFVEEDKVPKLKTINRPFLASFNSLIPENENWVQLIELFRKECQCADSRKIGLVVDSDLGNIESYNRREKPIFKDYLLPEEFELIFASDKVSDNLFNEMIKRCHYLSNMFIKEIEEKISKAQA
ncbi:MAG TPA: hypothetical protein VIJ75_03835 [Hanamia sp.]